MPVTIVFALHQEPCIMPISGMFADLKTTWHEQFPRRGAYGMLNGPHAGTRLPFYTAYAFVAE